MINCSYCNTPIEDCITRLRKLYPDKDKLIESLIRHGHHGEVSRGLVKLDNQPKAFSIKRRNRINRYPFSISTYLSQKDYDKVMLVASSLNIKRTTALRKIVTLFDEKSIIS